MSITLSPEIAFLWPSAGRIRAALNAIRVPLEVEGIDSSAVERRAREELDREARREIARAPLNLLVLAGVLYFFQAWFASAAVAGIFMFGWVTVLILNVASAFIVRRRISRMEPVA